MSGTSAPRKAPASGAFCFQGSRGFTVIELVCVIVIVGVLAAMATPKMFDMLPYEERGYADEIAAGLRYSRILAVASGCNVRFSVDLAGFSAAQHAALNNPWTGHCDPGGAWTTPVNRADGTALAGAPPSRVNVLAATQIEFNEWGDVVGGAPAPVVVGPYRIAVSAGGGVSVQ